MEEVGEVGQGTGMSVARLEAFSDGVLAVVITILILDIKVPSIAQHRGQLAPALGAQWPTYLAYLLSFLVVGIIWLNHHATVNLLACTDHPTQVFNLLLLLPVSVLPWATSLLAEYARHGTAGDERLAVVVYGGVSTVMTLTFNLLWRYLLRHPELHKPHVTPELLAVRNQRYNLGLPAYPVATVLGLINPIVFLALMIGLALLYLLPTPDTQLTSSQQQVATASGASRPR